MERASVSAHVGNVCPWDNLGKCYINLHGWKEDSMLVKRITACTHLSQLFPSNSTRKFKSSPS